MTEGAANRTHTRPVLATTLCCAFLVGLLALTGCASDPAKQEDPKRGYGMGGVEQDIAILAETIDAKPAPWDLSTPELAVRSYLDWVSYSYRIGESDEATPTQTPHQVVRTDAYVQANLQQERLLDQTLTSIDFGKASVDGTRAVIPARETWSYRYVSIKEAGTTIGSPNTASYETTYALVKTEDGWVVDDIEVKALGEVK